MKTRTYAITTVAAFAAALLVQSALAQSTPLRATIPFDFYVVGKLMPAGTYTIAASTNGAAIQVSDRNGNSAFALPMAVKSNRLATQSRLVFHRYGNVTFLSDLYWEGSLDGRELVRSKLEKELMASNASAPIRVAIAAYSASAENR